jgi:hypothetical protein
MPSDSRWELDITDKANGITPFRYYYFEVLNYLNRTFQKIAHVIKHHYIKMSVVPKKLNTFSPQHQTDVNVFTLQLLYFWANSSQYPADRMITDPNVGLQEAANNKFILLPEISNHISSAHRTLLS